MTINHIIKRKWYHSEVAQFFFGLVFLALLGLLVIGYMVAL